MKNVRCDLHLKRHYKIAIGLSLVLIAPISLTRNLRLTAIRSFYRMVALRDPASVGIATHVLAIPTKRTDTIIRPLAARARSLIQLDDLSPSQLDRVRGFSFLVLETSPESLQAWLAVQGADAVISRRIKKAAGADPSASGATRIAGSYNFKPKYVPDYPRVRLQSIAPKRIVPLPSLLPQV